jgi:hypothetical protein
MDNRIDNRLTDGGKVVFFKRRPRFNPRNIFLVRPEGLGKVKKCVHLNRSGTRDLPACRIVPQPTTLPRAPFPSTVQTENQIFLPRINSFWLVFGRCLVWISAAISTILAEDFPQFLSTSVGLIDLSWPQLLPSPYNPQFINHPMARRRSRGIHNFWDCCRLCSSCSSTMQR